LIDQLISGRKLLNIRLIPGIPADFISHLPVLSPANARLFGHPIAFIIRPLDGGRSFSSKRTVGRRQANNRSPPSGRLTDYVRKTNASHEKNEYIWRKTITDATLKAIFASNSVETNAIRT